VCSRESRNAKPLISRKGADEVYRTNTLCTIHACVAETSAPADKCAVTTANDSPSVWLWEQTIDEVDETVKRTQRALIGVTPYAAYPTPSHLPHRATTGATELTPPGNSAHPPPSKAGQAVSPPPLDQNCNLGRGSLVAVVLLTLSRSSPCVGRRCPSLFSQLAPTTL
jgi:hypothetical protein